MLTEISGNAFVSVAKENELMQINPFKLFKMSWTQNPSDFICLNRLKIIKDNVFDQLKNILQFIHELFISF